MEKLVKEVMQNKIISHLQKDSRVKAIALIAIFGAVPFGTYIQYLNAKKKANAAKPLMGMADQRKNDKVKAAVDQLFFKRLRRIFKIIIPSPFSRESAYIIILTG